MLCMHVTAPANKLPVTLTAAFSSLSQQTQYKHGSLLYLLSYIAYNWTFNILISVARLQPASSSNKLLPLLQLVIYKTNDNKSSSIIIILPSWTIIMFTIHLFPELPPPPAQLMVFIQTYIYMVYFHINFTCITYKRKYITGLVARSRFISSHTCIAIISALMSSYLEYIICLFRIISVFILGYSLIADIFDYIYSGKPCKVSL